MAKDDETNHKDDLAQSPTSLIPSEELGRYTIDHDPHDEASICDYVNGQCQGEETVQYVERIKTEYVHGERYDAWDVHTDKQRWWVITNLTNLYTQSHFPSLDYTLSFHIGLMHRIQARQQREYGPEFDPFGEVYRRLSKAADLIEKAIEAEEFQSAAMQMRECLITLVGVVRRRVDLSLGGELPKDADVLGWNEILINHFCPGAAYKTLRQYLKDTSKRTWHLVNWLTHDRDANKTEAIIANEAVSLQIGHFAQLVIRNRVDVIVQCPRCMSRDVHSYYDALIESDGAYYQRCRACDWSDHPGYGSGAIS